MLYVDFMVSCCCLCMRQPANYKDKCFVHFNVLIAFHGFLWQFVHDFILEMILYYIGCIGKKTLKTVTINGLNKDQAAWENWNTYCSKFEINKMKYISCNDWN